MDSSARWFLAGIIVSLVNSGFVILFLFLPRISDGSALDIFNNEPIQAEEIIAPKVVVEYKVVILNDSGDILFSESELDGEAVDRGVNREALLKIQEHLAEVMVLVDQHLGFSSNRSQKNAGKYLM